MMHVAKNKKDRIVAQSSAYLVWRCMIIWMGKGSFASQMSALNAKEHGLIYRL